LEGKAQKEPTNASLNPPNRQTREFSNWLCQILTLMQLR
jgi:hypothetical protein